MEQHISLETKEAIVKQALERNGKSIAEITAHHNIGYSTLQRWLHMKKQGCSKGKS